MGRILALILAFMLLFGGAVAYWAHCLSLWRQQPQAVLTPQLIDFPRGTPLVKLAAQLQESGVITSSSKFTWWLKISGEFPKFQAGQYRFVDQVSPQNVIEAIKNGQIFVPVAAQFTVPEGFTVKMFVERLPAHGIGTVAQVKALVKNKAFLKSLRIPSNSLEGFLYPATYTFPKVPTPEEAIQKVVDTFWSRLPSDYEAKITGKGLTLQQAVTFASLIELETMNEDEKPLISEVIWRRLKDRAPLAIDAAIIYGIKDYKGDIRWKDLSDASNIYNTRIHRGLPPTPIGSPSASSMEAVLRPSNLGNYFYVIDSNHPTRHKFSKTLKEHNRAVEALVKRAGKDELLPKPKKMPTAQPSDKSGKLE